MNKLIISALSLLITSILLLPSCTSGDKSFSIKGEISNAEDEVLYLEHRSLSGLQVLDSVKLKANGQFKFKSDAPENPEFYQLRLGNQAAVFAVDSIENIELEADGSDLFNTYKIESSIVNEQIRKIIDMQHDANKNISNLLTQHENEEIEDVAFMEKVDSVLTVYKDYANKIILSNPSSAAAYYAVFQKIDDYLIFDPYDRKDYAMFGAIATSWNRYYPDTQRTKHLYDFTINALRSRKQQENTSKLGDNVTLSESQLPDISLSNVKGQKTSVSSFKGNVVVLDFTAYKTEFSLQHNERIQNAYDKYKSKGLVVYQISFDSDAHFWKNVSVELPWTTVYEPQSVNSDLLRRYNVRELPTAYILNREGDLIQRVEDFEKLDEYLAKLL